MSDSAQDRPTRGPGPPANDRLESWKEIAAYLDKGVSTVQRWERDASLPVYRHSQGNVLNVYASRSELDAWRNHPGMPPAEGNAGHTLESAPLVPAAPRRWGRLVAGAGVVVVAVAVGASLWQVRAPSLEFEARDWVLIADFDNQTGGAIADGTVEYALAHALGESRFVNVVPRERVVDTLGLMRRPPETAVDTAVGREIALRDGGIRAVLTGRVDKLDSTYAVSAVLIEPATGRTVASVREEAAGDSAFLPAVQRLSNRVRARLGEALADIERSARALEKVTTPSLSALQLFSQADALIPISIEKNKVAEGLLRQAVAEDPDFASGYMHLAWTISNQQKPAAEYLPPAERAVELAGRVSERERYFILGSYHQMLGEAALDEDLATIKYEQAVTVYEALLRLYPDHYWGTSNLAGINARLGRQEEALRWRVRRADLRPNDFRLNALAALHLLMRVGDVVAATPYVERARAALPEWSRQYTFLLPRIELFAAYDYWLRGDVKRASAEADRVAATLAARSGRRERSQLAQHLGSFYLTLGRLDAARDLVRHFPPSEPRNAQRWLAEIALAGGDRGAAREHLQTFLRIVNQPQRQIESWTFLRAGLVSEARLPPLDSNPIPLSRMVWGTRALREGQYQKAILLLEEGLEGQLTSNGCCAFEGYEALAEAWLAAGDLEAAVRVLEKASQRRGRAAVVGGGYWIRNQWRLSQLYGELGRQQEAARIEAELLKLLAHADPDHVILRELKRLS